MIGRPVDLSYRYKTMDTKFMEPVQWAFSELYKKDLIYKGVKILPHIDVNSIYFLCKTIDDYNLFVWTTTPWAIESKFA